jgi:hypothetical protein
MPTTPTNRPPHDPGAAAGMRSGVDTHQARAREVHALVLWAVRERSRAICRGWSKVDPQAVRTYMIPLQQWLQRYQVPSPETMRLFLHEHWQTVRVVMPGNAAGKKKLERLHELLSQA